MRGTIDLGLWWKLSDIEQDRGYNEPNEPHFSEEAIDRFVIARFWSQLTRHLCKLVANLHSALWIRWPFVGCERGSTSRHALSQLAQVKAEKQTLFFPSQPSGEGTNRCVMINLCVWDRTSLPFHVFPLYFPCASLSGSFPHGVKDKSNEFRLQCYVQDLHKIKVPQKPRRYVVITSLSLQKGLDACFLHSTPDMRPIPGSSLLVAYTSW